MSTDTAGGPSNLLDLVTHPGYDGDEDEFVMAAISSVMESVTALDPYFTPDAAEKDRWRAFNNDAADLADWLKPEGGGFIDASEKFNHAIHHFEEFVCGPVEARSLSSSVLDGDGYRLDRYADYTSTGIDPIIPALVDAGPRGGYEFTAAWPSSKSDHFFYVSYTLPMREGSSILGNTHTRLSWVTASIPLEKRKSIEPALMYRQIYTDRTRAASFPSEQGTVIVFAVGI